MLNLYKVDLLRIVKDKLFIVTCVLVAFFAILNPVLNKVIIAALEVEEELEMFGIINAKQMFFSAFLPGDNLGLIMPILIAIIVCKDFSQGTVRNKIISGNSRANIFLSHLLASATIVCSLILVHALLTLAVALIFFPYQETPFGWKDFGYLMASLGFELVIYVAVASIVTFIATSSKNMGTCIVLYLAVALGLTIVGSIIQVVGAFSLPEDKGYKLVEFLTYSNFFVSNVIGVDPSYSFKEVAYILAPPILTSAGCILLGIFNFNKKNLK